MGVDIAFHIEVRHKNKWHALRWQTPMVLERYPSKEDEGKEWTTHFCCYLCRYYHFQDLIEDSTTTTSGLPDDCCEDIRDELKESCSGSLPFEDVIHFCAKAEKEMLFNLSHAKECQFAKTIHRIEKAVRQKPIPKTLEPDEDYHTRMTIKQIYDEYQDEVACIKRLRDIVWALLDDYYGISSSDVRLIYRIC